MKVIVFVYLLLLPVLGLCQHKAGKYKIGAFIGESTGVLVNRTLSSVVSLQLNVGINELFLNYDYTSKFVPYHVNQAYDNIYSVFAGPIYQKNTRGTSFFYRVGAGVEGRIVTRYSYQPANNDVNLIIIDDPKTETRLDLGTAYFLGFGYKIGNKYSIFGDIGGYSEVEPVFLWSNLQFKLGIMYLINSSLKTWK